MKAQKLPLEEFLKRAPVALEAFAAATRHHGETDATFRQDRDEIDWWREVAAYAQFVELQEREERAKR